MTHTTTYLSPVGKLTLAAEDDCLTGLWIEGQKHFGQGLEGNVTVCPDYPVLLAAARWLDRYFAGQRPEPEELPIKLWGSEFCSRVLDILYHIPYGETMTYGEIAGLLNMGKMSAQAVGGAVGHNPIGIIIPCHRVLGAGGKLTGYAAGTEKKLWLLRHEGVIMESHKSLSPKQRKN